MIRLGIKVRRKACFLALIVVLAWGRGMASPPQQPSSLPDLPRLSLEHFPQHVRAKVEKAYNAALANPQDAYANGQLGMILQAFNQSDGRAAICYRRAHQLDPASFRWAYFLGLVLAAEGKFDEAAVVLRQGLVLLPEYLPAQLKLGECLLGGGKREEAGAIYAGILERHGASAEAHYGLGRVQAARKELEGAAESLRKACEIFPIYGAAHYALALVYRDQGKTEKSREELALYEKSKHDVPGSGDWLLGELKELYTDPQNLLQMGTESANQGKYEQAVAEHERALGIDSQLIKAHVNLIPLYGRLGQFEKAEEHYRAAVGLLPDYPDSHYYYGLVLVQQGKHREAAEAFRKVLEINPYHADAHNYLGDLLQREGKLPEAVAEFRRAVENRPSFPQAHFNLGRILVNQGNYQEGIEHFLRSFKAADEANKATCLYAVGAAYARAGDRPQAVRYLRLAREQAAAQHQDKLLVGIERDLQGLEGGNQR